MHYQKRLERTGFDPLTTFLLQYGPQALASQTPTGRR